MLDSHILKVYLSMFQTKILGFYFVLIVADISMIFSNLQIFMEPYVEYFIMLAYRYNFCSLLPAEHCLFDTFSHISKMARNFSKIVYLCFKFSVYFNNSYLSLLINYFYLSIKSIKF